MHEDEAVQSHYALGVEHERLDAALPPPPADLLDVGGGPGVYASRFARAGYRVQLLDVVPLHVEQASALAARQPDAPFTATIGDARDLRAHEDETVDAVLL